MIIQKRSRIALRTVQESNVFIPLGMALSEKQIGIRIKRAHCPHQKVEHFDDRSLIAGGLPTELQGELNLPRGCCRRSQQAGGPGRSSCGIEDVGVVGGYGHGEVRMVQDIKELRPKLCIEVLRNSLDVVVLEHGEI